MDLYGRAIVDIAIDLINGYLFCGQASSKVDMEVAVAGESNGDGREKVSMRKRKAIVALRYVTKNAPKITALKESILAGDTTTFSDYEVLIGPVPEN